jgi:SH3-like domain-containing protein
MPNSANRPKLPKGQRYNKFLALVCLLGIVLIPGMAAAFEYRSVAVPKAVLYDAPSGQAKKLFVVSQGYPVELIVDLGNWIKVRDHFGTLSWIEAKDLGNTRTLIVTANNGELRQAGDISSQIISRVEKDVLLEMLEPPAAGLDGSSWIKVRHRDGLTGYIQATSVWGY